MLEENGVPTHRRNLEILSRGFFDRVKVTSPDGVAGFNIGEVVPYSEIQRRYKPRDGHEDRSPTRSTGYYLERPVLHYTIGTRLTPSVVAKMKEAGIPAVKVHREPPGFIADVRRLMDIMSTDPDWKTRMAGWDLKKSFLHGVTHGSESPHESVSFVSSLMDPEKL